MEDQRPISNERPLASSTPAPRPRSPEPRMTLAEMTERHKDTIYGPREKKQRTYFPPKGRQSYIPSQEEARRQDEIKYGSKAANDERIARNKEKDEKRWQAIKIKKMEDELEKEKWKVFEGMQSPSPPRGRSPTIILNRGDRREHHEYEEIFGGPRRRQDQPRPGTSSGSCPSGRLF